jgi:hypothetical protein
MELSTWDDVPQASIDRIAAQDALRPVTHPCFQYSPAERVVTWCFSYSPADSKPPGKPATDCFRY